MTPLVLIAVFALLCLCVVLLVHDIRRGEPTESDERPEAWKWPGR